jgi:pyruvate dehydrogenase E1 component alpha subunit
MPTLAVDGNDAGAVHDAAVEAVARARSGGGPSFVLADTYRWREHCGPNYDNTLGYRTEAEFETWKARDPVVALEARLTRSGALDAATRGAWEREIRAEIEAGFAFAEAAPFPDPAGVADGLYAG